MTASSRATHLWFPTPRDRRLAALIARERLVHHRPPSTRVYNGSGPYSSNARQRAFWGALAEVGFGLQVRQIPDAQYYEYGDDGDFLLDIGHGRPRLRVDIKFSHRGILWTHRENPFSLATGVDVLLLARPTDPPHPASTGIEYYGWADRAVWADHVRKEEWPRGSVWTVPSEHLATWHSLMWLFEPWHTGD